MKNLRRLACNFDLDQSELKSSQVNASARRAWPNEVEVDLSFQLGSPFGQGLKFGENRRNIRKIYDSVRKELQDE